MSPRICVVQINVPDMDRALDFYCDTLGFEIATRAHYPHIVPLVNEGVSFVLNLVDDVAIIDYPRVAQTLVNFETDDLAGSLRRLEAGGAELIHRTPQDCPVGVYAAVRDPFGNVFEMLEYRR